MARFHAYRLKSAPGHIIDLQADLLDALKTRIVAPLLPASNTMRPISRLNPQFAIDGQSYTMCTHLMAAVSIGEIGDMVADLSDHRDEIIAAVDFAFQGF